MNYCGLSMINLCNDEEYIQGSMHTVSKWEYIYIVGYMWRNQTEHHSTMQDGGIYLFNGWYHFMS